MALLCSNTGLESRRRSAILVPVACKLTSSESSETLSADGDHLQQ